MHLLRLKSGENGRQCVFLALNVAEWHNRFIVRRPSQVNAGLAASFVLLSALGLGCGRSLIFTRADGGIAVANSVQPLSFWVRDGGCPTRDELSRAKTILSAGKDFRQSLALVEVEPVEECSSVGGHYLTFQEVGSSRQGWLGGHTCFMWQGSAPTSLGAFGVARFVQTAAILSTQPGWCIHAPGSTVDGISSDRVFSAVATFSTLADAEAFLAGLSP